MASCLEELLDSYSQEHWRVSLQSPMVKEYIKHVCSESVKNPNKTIAEIQEFAKDGFSKLVMKIDEMKKEQDVTKAFFEMLDRFYSYKVICSEIVKTHFQMKNLYSLIESQVQEDVALIKRYEGLLRKDIPEYDIKKVLPSKELEFKELFKMWVREGKSFHEIYRKIYALVCEYSKEALELITKIEQRLREYTGDKYLVLKGLRQRWNIYLFSILDETFEGVINYYAIKTKFLDYFQKKSAKNSTISSTFSSKDENI